MRVKGQGRRGPGGASPQQGPLINSLIVKFLSVSAARTTEAADCLTSYLVAGEEKPWMHVSVALLSFSFLVFYWLQGPPRVPRAYIYNGCIIGD